MEKHLLTNIHSRISFLIEAIIIVMVPRLQLLRNDVSVLFRTKASGLSLGPTKSYNQSLLDVKRRCAEASYSTASKHVNPLTPELNPSVQRCLTRVLLEILLLESCISLIYA
jgi:hypothetical protein